MVTEINHNNNNGLDVTKGKPDVNTFEQGDKFTFIV